MIGRSGCLGPSASVAAPSVQRCSDDMATVLAPPVSASDNKVYFRDGDTRVRFMTPSGESGDATTIPGGPTTVSFFSVSPDDQRIAVVVEDLSAAGTISLRLYVENLIGGGGHADIYKTTIPKSQSGMTLWPAGWHQGRLVLAVVLACAGGPVYHPSAWHVVDAATADRLVNIDVSACRSSLLPSVAGVICYGPTIEAKIYDWAGNVTSNLTTTFLDLELPVGLSPSGQSMFYNQGTACQGGTQVCPRVWADSPGGGAHMPLVEMHSGCLWIDNSAILAPDAVIAFPSGVVSPLRASGDCVGRFPGGL
jgi:hypothetical protein